MLETSLMDAAGILKETLYEYEPAGNRRATTRTRGDECSKSLAGNAN